MVLISIPASAWERGVDWGTTRWHVIVHVLGIVGVAVVWWAYNPYTVLLMVGIFLLGHLSIRLGAHTLYTHQGYSACYALHVALIICYNLAMQGPLRYLWCPMHVLHHRSTKTDPYNVDDGILWAHMIWSCFNLPRINNLRTTPWLFRAKTSEEARIPKLLAFQERYVWGLGMGLGIALPTSICALWGDYLAVFVAFLRLLCQYHFTWQINSLSHLVGPQPYTKEDSSRDSPWWLFGIPAWLSVGEASGHNHHHRFPRDFRTGPGWWRIDPGKWVLYSLWAISQVLRHIGLRPIVWDLHRYSDEGGLQLLH